MPHNEILKAFAKYIESELGIIYAQHNYFQLQNRLEEIAKLMGVCDIAQLHAQFSAGVTGSFKQLLLDVATNNETSFFRDTKIFRAIEASVLEKISDFLKPGEKLRIWSAASSTGQEAISTSILITEFNKKKNLNIQYSILATDISERVLAKAKAATYSQLEIQRGLPAPFLIKYFRKNDLDQWIATDEILKPIEFKKQNLKDPFPFREKFHLILCRNVLIYQSVEGKIEILKRIFSLLAPGGILVLGSGESLIGLSVNYEQENIDGAIIYRKKVHEHQAA